ncbi:BA75_02008T0 [Komagataella pastoris]|uniref:BA75_02008T0 n=1 Tax=Komagataella pastoris TaxID=4922 RepID=A0A1B2JB81_PICPA|nr:BA75_02008T0 [Komagataella pastoris]
MSSVVYLGGIPYHWDLDTIKSVVYGSGRIVDVRCMMDHPGKNKGFCFVEYQTPAEAEKAVDILARIHIQGNNRTLRAELSKEGLRFGTVTKLKDELILDRSHFPPNVTLPPEMTTNPNVMGNSAMNGGGGMPDNGLGGLDPSMLQQLSEWSQNPEIANIIQQLSNNGMNIQQIYQMLQQSINKPPQEQRPTNFNQPISGTNMEGGADVVPEYLLRASDLLELNTAVPFRADSVISENCSKLTPPVFVQLIANLKNALNKNASLEDTKNLLQKSPDSVTNIAQALLLMGLIDESVIQYITTKQQQQQQSISPPPAQIPTPVLPTVTIPPQFQGLQQHTVEKLSQLTPQEAEMVAQVLQFAPSYIQTLPPDQRQVAEQIRAQYL